MRLFLTFLAMAILTIAVGCAPKEAAKPQGETGTSSPESSETSSDSSATSPDTSNMQEVSLKLPGMT